MKESILDHYNATVESDGTVIIQGENLEMFVQVEEATIEERNHVVQLSNSKVSVSLFKEISKVHITIF